MIRSGEHRLWDAHLVRRGGVHLTITLRVEGFERVMRAMRDAQRAIRTATQFEEAMANLREASRMGRPAVEELARLARLAGGGK